MNKRKIVIGSVAALLATGFTACGNVNKIMNEINEGNYEVALEIMNSKKLSEKNLTELSEEMKICIEEQLTNYANNTCTYDEISSLISTAYSMNIASLTSTLATASANMESLHASKTAYEEGISAFSNESYAEAYTYFGYVIEEDQYYTEASDYMEKCVSSYCDNISKKVDDYVSKDDYEAALNYLGECNFSAFDDRITVTIVQLTEDVRVKFVLYDAENYVKNNDTSAALTLIKDSIETYEIKETSELDQLYNEISIDYVTMIMEKVTLLCSEEKYILALNMLHEAKKIVDASEFSEAIEEINAVKPTYLYDLKYSTSNRFETIDSGDPLMDTIGNLYDVGNLFELSGGDGGWGDDDVGYVEYNLGYNYNLLSGIISVSDISDEATATLKIEGDGTVLYSLPLSRLTTPTPFSLDVSNVNWLKFTVTDLTDGDIYAILSECQFDSKVAEPVTEPTTDETTTPTEETTSNGTATATS